MNKKILVILLLTILVIMSFVQGIQINSLKKAFKEDSAGIKSQTETNKIDTYSNPVANAPAMVGGC